MADKDTSPRLELEGAARGMLLKPGTRLVSQVCSTEVVVVRSPEGEVDLRCGGHAMVLPGGEVDDAGVDAAHASGTLLGKRYGDELGVQVLCTKAGDGSLSVGGVPLTVSDTKALPSSD